MNLVKSSNNVQTESDYMKNKYLAPPDESWYANFDLPSGWKLISDKLEGKFALDIGCATGWLSYHAKKAGARVISSDIYATNFYPGLEFLICDKSHLPFKDETFDCVLTSNTLHHGDLVRSCTEARRALRTGGMFASLVEPCILSTMNEYETLMKFCSQELADGIDERRPNLCKYKDALSCFSRVEFFDYVTLEPVLGDENNKGLTVLAWR